jgi:hypothetical protein
VRGGLARGAEDFQNQPPAPSSRRWIRRPQIRGIEAFSKRRPTCFASRAMRCATSQRSWKFDPATLRPSSEALFRD